MTPSTQVLPYEYDKYIRKAVAPMLVKIKVYDEVKYNPDSKKVAEVEYEISSFKVVEGEEAEAMARETDEDGQDEFNEYLVLELANGETATFRNSHVDMFRI